MMTVTPQGPGFLIFFQTKVEHYSWKGDGLGRKHREDSEILVLLTAMYESGSFG